MQHRSRVFQASSHAALLQLQAVTDANIFVFALNLEYMEADFYSWASTVSRFPGRADMSPRTCPHLHTTAQRSAAMDTGVVTIGHQHFVPELCKRWQLGAGSRAGDVCAIPALLCLRQCRAGA